ncbi:MAG: hypothetical protein KBB40_02275 [Clostridia bacterium]|nr:hypothetical protein [Clostridia bacterium]
MVDEKYIKSVNIIVEDEGDINVTDKSRRSNYSALISKGDEGDIDVISKRQNSMIQQ